MIAYGLWVGDRDKESMRDFMAWGQMDHGLMSRTGRRREALWKKLRRSAARHMNQRRGKNRRPSALR